MLTTTTIGYVNDKFEFKTLNKVDEVPTYNNLTKIKNQLMINVSNVQSDPGGGINGHLSLVLSATKYLIISQVLYVKILHPGPLPLVKNNNLPATMVERE